MPEGDGQKHYVQCWGTFNLILQKLLLYQIGKHFIYHSKYICGNYEVSI